MKWILPLVSVFSGIVVADELPQLGERKWEGWYCGYEAKEVRFGVKYDGEAVLIPLKKGKDVSSRQWIDIKPVIEEVKPNGKVVTKEVKPDGWEAITPASAEAEKISYRGTVTGGATFEVHFEPNKSGVVAGGRIVDKGELTEHPIRFSMRVRIPNLYSHDKDEKKLEKKVKGDKIQMVRADGKKLKLNGLEPVDASSKDMNGPGISEARIDLEGYDGARIELEAGDGGLFEFWNGSERSLYKGFTMGWKPDPAKDPEGKARFTLTFK